MSAFWGVFLSVCLLIASLTAVCERVRISILRKRLESLMYNSAETNSFLNLFYKNINDADKLMNTAARYVADLVEAQSVCIFVLEGEYLNAAGIAGVFPLLRRANSYVSPYVMTKKKYVLNVIRKEKIRMGEGIIGSVAQSMNPVLITNSKDSKIASLESHNSVPIQTLMAVPMIFEGSCTGVICAVNNRRDPDNPFDADQFERLKFIKGHIVLAQDILKSYENLSRQQRLNQELDFARNLQRSLLPDGFPDWGHFEIRAFTRASKEVSGDFYDFIEIDQDRLLVVIGDACGKGIPACMIMAMTRTFIRAHIDRFTSLRQLLLQLNENLYRDTSAERYITLGVCLLNRKESTLEFARAGHTELLLYIRNHIRCINPEGAGLGLLPAELAEFDTFCVEFTPDMQIMMFTDGINEALSPFGEQFGVEQIKQNFMNSCLDNVAPEVSIRRLLRTLDDFTERSNDQADDQTVVIIRSSQTESSS